jgi:hypothetical protein
MDVFVGLAYFVFRSICRGYRSLRDFEPLLGKGNNNNNNNNNNRSIFVI